MTGHHANAMLDVLICSYCCTTQLEMVFIETHAFRVGALTQECSKLKMRMDGIDELNEPSIKSGRNGLQRSLDPTRPSKQQTAR